MLPVLVVAKDACQLIARRPWVLVGGAVLVLFYQHGPAHKDVLLGWNAFGTYALGLACATRCLSLVTPVLSLAVLKQLFALGAGPGPLEKLPWAVPEDAQVEAKKPRRRRDSVSSVQDLVQSCGQQFAAGVSPVAKSEIGCSPAPEPLDSAQSVLRTAAAYQQHLPVVNPYAAMLPGPMPVQPFTMKATATAPALSIAPAAASTPIRMPHTQPGARYATARSKPARMPASLTYRARTVCHMASVKVKEEPADFPRVASALAQQAAQALLQHATCAAPFTAASVAPAPPRIPSAPTGCFPVSMHSTAGYIPGAPFMLSPAPSSMQYSAGSQPLDSPAHSTLPSWPAQFGKEDVASPVPVAPPVVHPGMGAATATLPGTLENGPMAVTVQVVAVKGCIQLVATTHQVNPMTQISDVTPCLPGHAAAMQANLHNLTAAVLSGAAGALEQHAMDGPLDIQSYKYDLIPMLPATTSYAYGMPGLGSSGNTPRIGASDVLLPSSMAASGCEWQLACVWPPCISVDAEASSTVELLLVRTQPHQSTHSPGGPFTNTTAIATLASWAGGRTPSGAQSPASLAPASLAGSVDGNVHVGIGMPTTSPVRPEFFTPLPPSPAVPTAERGLGSVVEHSSCWDWGVALANMPQVPPRPRNVVPNLDQLSSNADAHLSSVSLAAGLRHGLLNDSAMHCPSPPSSLFSQLSGLESQPGTPSLFGNTSHAAAEHLPWSFPNTMSASGSRVAVQEGPLPIPPHAAGDERDTEETDSIGVPPQIVVPMWLARDNGQDLSALHRTSRPASPAGWVEEEPWSGLNTPRSDGPSSMLYVEGPAAVRDAVSPAQPMAAAANGTAGRKMRVLVVMSHSGGVVVDTCIELPEDSVEEGHARIRVVIPPVPTESSLNIYVLDNNPGTTGQIVGAPIVPVLPELAARQLVSFAHEQLSLVMYPPAPDMTEHVETDAAYQVLCGLRCWQDLLQPLLTDIGFLLADTDNTTSSAAVAVAAELKVDSSDFGDDMNWDEYNGLHMVGAGTDSPVVVASKHLHDEATLEVLSHTTDFLTQHGLNDVASLLLHRHAMGSLGMPSDPAPYAAPASVSHAADANCEVLPVSEVVTTAASEVAVADATAVVAATAFAAAEAATAAAAAAVTAAAAASAAAAAMASTSSGSNVGSIKEFKEFAEIGDKAEEVVPEASSSRLTLAAGNTRVPIADAASIAAAIAAAEAASEKPKPSGSGASSMGNGGSNPDMPATPPPISRWTPLLGFSAAEEAEYRERLGVWYAPMDLLSFAILMVMFLLVTVKLVKHAAPFYNIFMLWAVATTVMAPYLLLVMKPAMYKRWREHLMLGWQLLNACMYLCFGFKVLPMPPEMTFHFNHSHIIQRGLVRPVRRPMRFKMHLLATVIEAISVTPALVQYTSFSYALHSWRTVAVTYTLSLAVGYSLDYLARKVFMDTRNGMVSNGGVTAKGVYSKGMELSEDGPSCSGSSKATAKSAGY